jgi:hypothetical protein
LTGTTIRRTTGSDLDARGVSMDQLAAKRIGVLTPIPSLELRAEPVTTGVDTNVGYTRLYGSHISWSTPTTPVAREIYPKLAFDRLFRPGVGKGASDDDDRSILDLVTDDARALRERIGRDDRRKLDESTRSARSKRGSLLRPPISPRGSAGAFHPEPRDQCGENAENDRERQERPLRC